MGGGEQKDRIFSSVYSRNIDLLITIVKRITACEAASEDICQEAFIRYYDRIGSVPEGDEARYWLIRVAKNLAYNYVNRRKREQKAYKKYIEHPENKEYTESDDSVFKDETCREVQIELDKLPKKLRDVLILKEYSGMNYKEIGKTLKISESNVKVRVFRARKILAKRLKEDNLYVPK